MTEKLEWKKDSLGDYNIRIDVEGGGPLYAKIIKCWPTSDGKQRWLLLVKNSYYGFYGSCQSAKHRFYTDCVPKGKCPDCGQPNGSMRCCQQDEDLWK